MAHVGGIDPVLANIDASPLVNVDIGASNTLMIHPPGKVPPDADYTSTAIVYGTHPTMTTPPQPLFTYTTTPPAGGTPVSLVHIDFSGTSNVTWKWNATTNTFQRYYNYLTPDMLANGVQNAAANVVVQYVQISYGPWAENSEGGLEVQADLYPNASGTATVFRNGVAIPATWHRTTLGVAHPVPRRHGQPHLHGTGPDVGGAGAQLHHRHHHALGGRPAGRLARHDGEQQAVPRLGEHAGVGARLGLVEHPRRHALPHQVEALALRHLEARRARAWPPAGPRRTRSRGPRSSAASERRRHTGPLGVSRQNHPPGARTRNASRATASPSASVTCSMDWPL